MNIQKRSPVTVILLSIITFGIYCLYWTVKTKDEINGFGAKIPTAWLMIIPFVNLYFFYKYSEGFSDFVKKDNSPILWFLLHLVIAPVFMILVQIELNKHALAAQAPAPESAPVQ